ncbi:MAG TPA: amidohydrolase family protein [Pseudonocardiaceae bacterium]|jgi:2,3-dihydroxybenzoate decarboxylase|nr:amidohydrolase family protein [Pseudonocardiaceae bacterium]
MADNPRVKKRAAVLPKIVLEEAYLHPDDARERLLRPDLLAGIAGSAGIGEGFYRAVLERLGEFDEVRLASMNENGIEHAILSLTAPGIQAIADPIEATSQARRQNDFLAEQIARNPDRYSGFAAVALQDPDAAAKELERTVHEFGFKGVLINGYTDTADGRTLYLDDAGLGVFWEAVAGLDVPVYLHPRPPMPSERGIYAGHPELLGATWGFGVETATHLLRIIFSGLLDRHPGVKLLVGHLGEGLPALLWRTQYNFDLNPFDKKIDKTLPEYFADNIWITTSGNFSDQALTSAILAIGADRILFSVDYPYADPALAARWMENTPISINDRRKIAHGNAEQLFGLNASR